MGAFIVDTDFIRNPKPETIRDQRTLLRRRVNVEIFYAQARSRFRKGEYELACALATDGLWFRIPDEICVLYEHILSRDSNPQSQG